MEVRDYHAYVRWYVCKINILMLKHKSTLFWPFAVAQQIDIGQKLVIF